MALFTIDIGKIDISDRLASLAERFLQVLEGGQSEQFNVINAKLDALLTIVQQQSPNAAELTAYREVLLPAVLETVRDLDVLTPNN